MSEKPRNLSRREFMQQAGLGAAALAVASAAPVGHAFASRMKGGMGYRILGRTGLEISEVILGGTQINPTNANLIRAALSQGINYIDTAYGYQKGNSEIAVGQVVKSMGIRDRIFIATKASGVKHRELLDKPASKVEGAIRPRLEESLQRLQTDYIDVYFAPHGCSRVEETAYPGLQEALEKFKKEGKIRFTAVSTHTNYVDVSTAAIEGGYYDMVMPVICSTTLVPELGQAARDVFAGGLGRQGARRRGRPILDMRNVLKAARKKNIGLIAMKAAKDGFTPPAVRGLVKSELAPEGQLSFHQVAYRYVLDQPEVSGVNIGMGNMTHLREALVLSQTTLKG